jgi:hypothetical protein
MDSTFVEENNVHFLQKEDNFQLPQRFDPQIWKEMFPLLFTAKHQELKPTYRINPTKQSAIAKPVHAKPLWRLMEQPHPTQRRCYEKENRFVILLGINWQIQNDLTQSSHFMHIQLQPSNAN